MTKVVLECIDGVDSFLCDQCDDNFNMSMTCYAQTIRMYVLNKTCATKIVLCTFNCFSYLIP